MQMTVPGDPGSKWGLGGLRSLQTGCPQEGERSWPPMCCSCREHGLGTSYADRTRRVTLKSQNGPERGPGALRLGLGSNRSRRVHAHPSPLPAPNQLHCHSETLLSAHACLVPHLIISLSRILELGQGNLGTKEEKALAGSSYSVRGGGISGETGGDPPRTRLPPAQAHHPTTFLYWCRAPDEPSSCPGRDRRGDPPLPPCHLSCPGPVP